MFLFFVYFWCWAQGHKAKSLSLAKQTLHRWVNPLTCAHSFLSGFLQKPNKNKNCECTKAEGKPQWSGLTRNKVVLLASIRNINSCEDLVWNPSFYLLKNVCGWQDGSVGRGAFHQGGWPEFNPSDPHSERRALTLQNYFTFNCSIHTYTCIHTDIYTHIHIHRYTYTDIQIQCNLNKQCMLAFFVPASTGNCLQNCHWTLELGWEPTLNPDTALRLLWLWMFLGAAFTLNIDKLNVFEDHRLLLPNFNLLFVAK